jgi:hypothetical protein
LLAKLFQVTLRALNDENRLREVGGVDDGELRAGR